MAAAAPRAPLSVYMLADHLDAVLAAGEDLVARGQDLRQLTAAPGNMQTFPARQRDMVEHIRGFELMIIARLLKARDHAGALATMDERFAALAKLFVSGTGVLLDAVEECGDATADDFETGDGVVAYVRSRGLIAANASCLSSATQLTIDDTFLIAKRIELGALMDLASSFIDALEVHYELFGADEEPEEAPLDMADVAGPADIETASPETHGSADQDEAAEPPAREPVIASAPRSPLSRLYSGSAPRREFGQRNRSPLN